MRLPTVTAKRFAESNLAPTASEFSLTTLTTEVQQFGPTLVVAPHPGDETLGCGGTIALLRRARVPVNVLVLSGGDASRSASQRVSRRTLARHRKIEALTALDRLGVLPPSVRFLELSHGDLPAFGASRFAAAVERCGRVFQAVQPSTVLVPWRGDARCDHRASWELTAVAAIRTGFNLNLRWLEYPSSLIESGAASEVPSSDESLAWHIDITPVMELKRHALRAHRSSITASIGSDRFIGFVREIFFEDWGCLAAGKAS